MITKQFLHKLKIPEGSRILVAGPLPGGSGPNPAGDQPVDLQREDDTAYGLVLVFGTGRGDLDELLARITPVDDTLTKLWVCYPKKSGSVGSDLSRDVIWELASQRGLRPVAQVSVNDDWSAIRLRPGSSVRPKPGSDIPGVDPGKRVVTPPADLAEALLESGLTEVFEKLSFTHKKEHVEAIVLAKKPETRARRILKCIEMLNK